MIIISCYPNNSMYNYYIVIIDLLPMFVPVLELVLCVNIVLFSSIYPIPTFLQRGATSTAPSSWSQQTHLPVSGISRHQHSQVYPWSL